MDINESTRWSNGTKRIPSLPKEVHHLILALADDTIGFRQLANTIEGHPSIAARLIALANSAWAAPTVPIETVNNACARLGFPIVRSVSIGLAVIAPFNVSHCPSFDIRRYWISSMLVADGASLLAVRMPQHNLLEQTVRTAGILHNFGLLCLAHQMPGETQQAFAKVMEDPELDLVTALRQTVKTDYCEAGAWVLETLGVPQSLASAVRHHRDFSYQGTHWELSRMIGYAAMIANALSNNQATLPEFEAISDIPLSDDSKKVVLNYLQERVKKNAEMANIIFS